MLAVLIGCVHTCYFFFLLYFCSIYLSMPSAITSLPDGKDNLLSRDFESLVNIDEIRECLRLIDEEETRIDSSLDTMLAQEQELDSSLSTLASLRYIYINVKPRKKLCYIYLLFLKTSVESVTNQVNRGH